MKYRIPGLLILVFTSCVSSYKCNNLAEGTYLIKYDKQFDNYDNYQLKISGSKAVQNYKNENIELDIEWIDKDRFRLIRKGEKTDSLTDLQKKLNSLGNPYFEITNCTKKIAVFTLLQNPHIIISSGKFVRQK